MSEVLRIAAVGDIHYTRDAAGRHRNLFLQADAQADVLCLCGDLTDYGTAEETERLVADLAGLRIPILAVLGNHDHECSRPEEVTAILEAAGVKVLSGHDCVIHGVGFAGAKGFCGGFGARALEPWGEASIKAFVQEAIDEATRLQRALSRLQHRQRVVVLHYSPIEETVRGEPEAILPFLGSSRLEEPIDRYGAAVVFHGHAHRGSPEGRTRTGVPVYNVAHPLLRRTYPDGPGFRLVEVPIKPARTEDPPIFVDAGAAESEAAAAAPPP